jgi:hypothetical protein
MKYSFLLVLFFIFTYSKLSAKDLQLQKQFIPLKDFIILKYDLFFKENATNIFKGGGIFGVAYQNINYNIKINEDESIKIDINAIMDKERYRSKRYFPKLKDCNQVRNKIFMNKYGYSFLKQNYNNLVNEESLTNEINNKILNISVLSDEMRAGLLNKTEIRINIVHPRSEKNISCSGNLIASELK